ncbi:MAG TPA: hypothetical protein VF116_11970 [Ktedonobacterales bacterium]
MALTPKLQAGVELARGLVATLRDPQFLPVIYPSLFAEGVLDGSLHATVLSALVLAGDRLGFTPVCDAPMFDDLDLALTGDASKRPDAAWLDRSTRDVRCLIEFERYTPASLVPKAKNLLVMGKAAGQTLDLAALVYWSYEHLPRRELANVVQVFAQGFTHGSGAHFRRLGCLSLVTQVVATRVAGNRVVIERITPRVMVVAGEDKPYMLVELLM